MTSEKTFAKVTLLLLVLCSVWAIGHISNNIMACNNVSWEDNQCILKTQYKQDGE